MQRIIEQHQDELVALCREFGVIRLELFGSAATDAFDPLRSDIDLIVEYPPDYDFGLWLDRYFALRDRLADLFGRPVDLVMAGAMRKPRFIESANETRQVLYAP
jgi:predicted nucleotidyltransferase